MAGSTTRSRSNGQGSGFSQAVREAQSRHHLSLSLPVLGDVQLPPAQHIAWYGGVALLVALECVEWPIALILATGKALADNHHSKMLREFGEALEEAG
jgi:hypothetical protein